MLLTAVIITKNEEKNIRRCLESVKDVVDEIVIVDSLSIDDTEKICREYNVNFVKKEWMGYSEQKNYANSLASNDWILSIDADEVLSDNLKNSIAEIRKKEFETCNVFSMNRLTNYCGKWIHHCGWYPDRKIRIWNRNVGQWNGEIHETIDFSDKTKENLLDGDLLHYSFATAQDYENQMFKFAKMRGQHYFQKGKKHASFYMVVSPVFNFIQHYFFQLGFLDGAAGFHICKISAKATKEKYKTLRQLINNDL